MLLSGRALALASSLAAAARALTPTEWRRQSIYQVLTDRFALTDLSTTAACDTSAQVYCGGTWQGLIQKLDYIQGMGFTAVWISPMVEQMIGNTSDGESYHRYWAQNIYEVNSAFGTAADLAAFSSALHDRGMYLMLDITPNDMAYDGCGDCFDYSIFNPFNSESYFHPFCLIDYSNYTSIQVCWEGDNTVSLPDLRTEDSDVRSIWNSWIIDVISNYSIDGLRIDSAQQIETSFWAGFEAAARVYMVGEVFNGDPSYVTPFQQYLDGLLNYPAYYWITQAFESTSGSISNLANGINTMRSTAENTSLYGSFLENHDNPRFPSLTQDMSLVKNAIAFTMLMDGIPIIYEGQEQHYSGGGVPNNREAIWLSGYDTSSELYTYITSLNRIRTRAIDEDSNYLGYQAWPMYTGSSVIAMRKGFDGFQVVSVFTNAGASGASQALSLTASVTGFTSGQTVVDVMSCTAHTGDSSGDLSLTLDTVPVVLYPSTGLSGSGICSSTTTTPPPSCNINAAVTITFDELKNTAYGDTIKIAGDVAALGNWSPDDAVALSASQYTSNSPLWSGAVGLTPESVIEYKFILVDSSGAVTWEADPNQTYTVPCAAATVSKTWQS